MFRIVGLSSLVLCGLVLVVSTGATQEKKGKAKGMLPPGWSKIGLSEEQKSKIYTIQMDTKGKIKKLEIQIEELKQQEKSEMRKFLSEEQKTLLAKVLLGEEPKKDKEK